MLRTSITFLVIAIIAAILGLVALLPVRQASLKFYFIFFVVLFILSFFFGKKAVQ